LLQEALSYEPLMSALTVEDLKAAAAKWLNRPPIVAVAYPHKAATGAAQ
jgi:zinc protease